MAARKLTKSPEGELYCKYFHNVVGKRDEECIKNEVKGGERHG